MLQFEPGRAPSPPKDAATVVVARGSERGLEVFCVKRHARSGFLGGAVVFPGGKVTELDHDPRWQKLLSPLSGRSAELGQAFAVAALRELLEEATLLPTTDGQLDHDRALALRQELAQLAAEQDDSLAFAQLLEKHRLVADGSRLEPFARWITPEAEPRRYDTRFYVLCLSEAQAGRHDEHETTESFWATPREVLDRWQRGEVFLAPPTSHTLELATRAASPEALRELAREQDLSPVCPHFVMDGEHAVLALPGDPLYPTPAPTPVGDAPTRFVMSDGRFVPQRIV